MKTAHTPSPSLCPEKRRKVNLLENDNPEVIEVMRKQSIQEDQFKVMLRIDCRTHILVPPHEATAEVAEKLRRKYCNYDALVKRGKRK